VRSDLLQFFDDVISDGIEWGGTKQKQICHRNSRGEKFKAQPKILKILIPKEGRDWGRGEKRKEFYFCA